jgi:hypothetical protein
MQIIRTEQRFCANECGTLLPKAYLDFCSNRCKLSQYSATIIAAWIAGTLQPRPFLNKVIRRHLLATLGEHCQRCGWAERNPHSNNIPVEVEHIDGDWRNIAPDNLTILCPNCHSLTKTFRGLNRGNGRPGRPGTNGDAFVYERMPHYPVRPKSK